MPSASSIEDRLEELSARVARESSSLEAITELLATRREAEEQQRKQAEVERQQAERERQQLRTMILRYVVGPVFTLLIGGGGAATYWLRALPQQTEQVQAGVEQEGDEIQQAVEVRLEEIETRLDRKDRVDKRIVEIQLDQQVELSAAIQYLGAKIDSISPRAASVPEPDVVTQGKAKAERILEARDGHRYDPADPLSDIR